MRAGGVVLAGGRSARMGTAKAHLEWHGSTLLHRAAAVLGRAVDGPVVVVRAAGQDLPDLPRGVVVVDDPAPGLGPLQGIGAGLAALADTVPVAFVCATDMPFLHPAFVRCVLGACGDADVALPFAHGFRQPLAAAYRTALAGPIAALLAAGRKQPGMLLRQCRVAVLDEAALLADPEVARLDPGLESLANLNEPDEYAAARARPPAPVVIVRGDVRRTVRAATLGSALGSALGLTRSPADAADRVTVNGVAARVDSVFPLVAGDHIVVDG